MRRSRAVLAIVTTLLLVGVSGCAKDGAAPAGSSAAQVINLTYATYVGQNDVFAQSAGWWMNRVTTLTKGRVKFKAFYSGSLLGPADILPGISSNQVDMGHVAPTYYPSQLPLSQVAIPFVSGNGLAVMKALNEVYAKDAVFRDEWSRQGVKVLGFGLVESAAIGSKKPVANMADLRGQRLRVTGTLAFGLSALGVGTASIPFTAVYQSVSTGVLDGYSGVPFQTAIAGHLQEVAPHMGDGGLGVFTAVALIGMSEHVWSSLPKDVQTAMNTASEGLPAASADIYAKADQQACDQLHKAGGSVALWPQSDALRGWQSQQKAAALAAWAKAAKAGGVNQDDVAAFEKDFLDAVTKQDASSSFTDGLVRCAG